ncbi:MAG: hypothetical protein ACK4M7_05260 [Burkholderiales bacterium]
MTNLEQTINKFGYKLTDFTECQLETLKIALEDNLDISTIANPKIDELVMNIVVHETVTNPEQTSMLPYLYPNVSFSQLGDIRKSVEAGDIDKLKKYTNLYKRDDLSKTCKSSIAILIKYDVDYTDLLDSQLSEQALADVISSRIPRMYRTNYVGC